MGEDICGGRGPSQLPENSLTQHDCVLPHRKPMYSNFLTQNSRLETFKTWPEQLAQTPSELASAGFFYTGYGDKVRCFSGGCGLEMWESGDKPRLEHAKWYPDCSFVRMLEEIDTENTGKEGNKNINEKIDCNGNNKNLESTGSNVNVDKIANTGSAGEKEDSDSEYDLLCKICLVETIKGSFNNIKNLKTWALWATLTH